MGERWPRVVAAIVLATTIAACGSSTDETAVKRAVNEWTAAVADRDSGSACTKLSPRLRASIERHLVGEGVRGSCRTWAARYISPRHPATHGDAHVRRVSIAGEHAVATVAAAGVDDADVDLVKVDGAWQIDDY
jgi:hypothetical protein